MSIPGTPKPRRVAAVLCAFAALMVLLCSAHLFAGGGGHVGAGVLLVVGLGLAAAAAKSFGPEGRRG